MGLIERYLEAVSVALINNCFGLIPDMLDAICPK
jgi:hypothetical protein